MTTVPEELRMKCRFSLVIPLLLAASLASAQSYPVKPVRIVVPFAPGGNVDINARTIAPGLGELLGQTVIVDNRPGAGGMIGGEIVSKSPADGYTLLLGSNSVYSVSPNVYRKPLFHPLRDLAPIVGVSDVPFVLVIHPSVPAKSFKEFITVVKSRPGVMTMATAGTGTSNHLIGELIQMRTSLRMTGVPYKGSGPALVDLLLHRSRLANHTVVGLLPTPRQGLDDFHRAVSRRAFLVGGKHHRERTRMIGIRSHEILQCQNKGGNGAFHVRGTAAVEHTVLHRWRKRIDLPVLHRAGGHDIGMTCEANQRRSLSATCPEIGCAVARDDFAFEAQGLQDVHHDIQAAGVFR